MLSASGRLSQPETLSLRVMFGTREEILQGRHKERWLQGDDAVVFLSARHCVNPTGDLRWVLTDKIRAWGAWHDSWNGGWRVRSQWMTGGRGRYDSELLVRDHGGGACTAVFGGVTPTACTISGNTLRIDGRHPTERGRWTWWFTRIGPWIDPNDSGFRCVSGGPPHHGYYNGYKMQDW